MLDNTKATENIIIEYVNFLKLKKLDPDAPKDLLKEHYGRKYEDRELAEKQASIALDVLEKIGRREFGFRKRYKELKKSLEPAQTSQDSITDINQVGGDHSLGHLI